jgi:hypothetical protein
MKGKNPHLTSLALRFMKITMLKIQLKSELVLREDLPTYYLRPPTWPPKLVGHLAFISLSGPGCAKLGLAGRNATPNGGPYPIWRLTDGRIKCCVVFDVVPEGDAISFLTPQTRLLSFSTSSGPIDEFGGSFCSSHSGLQSVPQKFIHSFHPYLYWCQEGVNSDIEGATWPCR